MALFSIWIDRENANIFEFSGKDTIKSEMHNKYVDHHTHRMDEFDHKRQETTFYQKIATRLNEVEGILILGPGVARYHLQNFLNEHFPMIAKKIVGCESMDHPTDQQIEEYSRTYFRKPPLT